MMQIGEWRIDVIDGGRFLHDGGILYGVVPKTLWQAVTPADDQNRVPLAMNCLLARNRRYNVLIDTGHGDKLSPLDRKAHGIGPGWPLLPGLREVGLAVEDIDIVVLSHLHWDHAGGATTRSGGKTIATFPSATYYVNRQEWADANSQAVELSGGYTQADFVPLAEQGRLALTEDEMEIVPGIRVIPTGGHTRGHQAVVVESQDQGIVFLGDIAPTAAHLRTMWCTAYDLDLIQTRRIKPQLLGEIADRGYWAMWNHDPETPLSRVVRHPQRGLVLGPIPPQSSSQGMQVSV